MDIILEVAINILIAVGSFELGRTLTIWILRR